MPNEPKPDRPEKVAAERVLAWLQANAGDYTKPSLTPYVEQIIREAHAQRPAMGAEQFYKECFWYEGSGYVYSKKNMIEFAEAYARQAAPQAKSPYCENCHRAHSAHSVYGCAVGGANQHCNCKKFVAVAPQPTAEGPHAKAASLSVNEARPRCPKCGKGNLVMRQLYDHTGISIQCPTCMPDGTWYPKTLADLAKFFPAPAETEAVRAEREAIIKFMAQTWCGSFDEAYSKVEHFILHSERVLGGGQEKSE